MPLFSIYIDPSFPPKPAPYLGPLHIAIPTGQVQEMRLVTGPVQDFHSGRYLPPLHGREIRSDLIDRTLSLSQSCLSA